MFLFSITRRDSLHRVSLPEAREFPIGNWRVRVVTDGWLSSAEGGPDEVVVRERAPLDRRCERVTLAEARFARNGSTADSPPVVELRKALLSGRQAYYHIANDGSLHCASHVRLLRAAGVQLEEDTRRLPELYLYRYVTPPRTLFRDIDQLLAGETLRFEFDGRGWRRTGQELYSPPCPGAAAGGPPQGVDGQYGAYGERNAAALRAAVAGTFKPGDSPRVLLSGGLDSSILFKIARDQICVEDSYSTSYPFPSQLEEEDTEREYALSAAAALGARHQFFAPGLADFVRGLVEAVAMAEEPVVHLQSVLMMLLFRDGLGPGSAAVMVGQGADGAYGLRVHGRIQRLEARARKYEPWQPLLKLGPALGALRLASKTVGRGGGLVEAMNLRWRPEDRVSDPRHVLWWLGVSGDPEWIRRHLNATVEEANATRATLMRAFQGHSANDLVSLLDFFGDVSVTQSVWAKLGEASGKWVYYPFNSPGVMDAAFETPWEVKLAEPKGVLRGVARRAGVPEFIITRPKANFNAMPKAWALPGGVFESLVPLAAKVFEDRRLRKAQSADWPKATTFWTMLNHAIWRRLFINGESVSTLLAEVETQESFQKFSREAESCTVPSST